MLSYPSGAVTIALIPVWPADAIGLLMLIIPATLPGTTVAAATEPSSSAIGLLTTACIMKSWYGLNTHGLPVPILRE